MVQVVPVFASGWIPASRERDARVEQAHRMPSARTSMIWARARQTAGDSSRELLMNLCSQDTPLQYSSDRASNLRVETQQVETYFYHTADKGRISWERVWCEPRGYTPLGAGTIIPMLTDRIELCKLFSAHGVEFLLVGGQAVIGYGYPRLTRDMDLWVRPTAENGEKVLSALQEFGVARQTSKRSECFEDPAIRDARQVGESSRRSAPMPRTSARSCGRPPIE